MEQEPANLQQLLDRIGQSAAGREQVCLGMIVDAVGRRSFGPLLLLAGVILFSPLSGIPGVPTTCGLLVLFISLQLLMRRRQFWLPAWLLRRSVTGDRLVRGLRVVTPTARVIDRGLRPRLTLFVGPLGQYVIALVCVAIALGIPLMEVVPFSATGAGLVLLIFGLAMITHDGLLVLTAVILMALLSALVAFTVLSA